MIREDIFIMNAFDLFYLVKFHDIDNALHLFSSIVNKTNFEYTALFKGLVFLLYHLSVEYLFLIRFGNEQYVGKSS